MKLPGKSITAQACCRVDLAGGTLDIWPLYLFHPGAVTVNFGVTIMTSCRITELPGKRIHLRSIDTSAEDRFAGMSELLAARKYNHAVGAYLARFFMPERGFLLETNSQSPAGAGISGSSALMICTTAALARFCDVKLSRGAIRQIAQNVEAQVINVPTGCQDYFPALYGGVNAIELRVDGLHRHAIAVPAAELDSRFVLAYTGAPRQSGINNWEVFKAHIHGDRRVFRNFEQIGAIARAMRIALSDSNWDEVVDCMKEEWQLRRTNAPGISTPAIEQIMAAAKRNGALAAKVCGAGGGGCVVLLVEPGAREQVAAAIIDSGAGASILECKVARRGLAVGVAGGV